MTSEDVLHAIEEEIVFGALLPQSRLIEEDLSERFGTKRHVVREAFLGLGKLGLISRVRNKGAFVSELTPRQVREIYEVRELLEMGAAFRTMLPVAPGVIRQMSAIQTRHTKATEERSYREVFRLNIAFHRMQYEACANHYLIELIEEYARKAHLIRAVKYGDSLHMKRVTEQHWAIIEALGGSDHARLADIIKAHLPGSPEEYIRQYELRYGIQTEQHSPRTGKANAANAPS